MTLLAPRQIAIAIVAISMSLPSFAQSGCIRLPIGSIALAGSSSGAAPIFVTPPPLLGVGDFVVEWWMWIGNVAPYTPVLFEFSTTLAVSISTSGGAMLWVSGINASSGYAPVQTVWQHWAVVRSSTLVSLFVSGVPIASLSVSASANLTAPSFFIGGNGGPSSMSPPPGNVPCLLTEFRVVLGSALYVGFFTPPTQPFDAIAGTVLLLHATSPAQLLLDSSSAAASVSASSGVSWNSAAPFSCYPSGSLSFPGASAALIRAPPTAAPLARGDWTIEFWASPQSLANSRIFSIGACCSALGILAIELQPGGSPAVSLLGVNMFAVWPPLYGSWVHMALVRNGTTVAWFVQGKLLTLGTVTATANFSASAASPLYIGGDTTFRAYTGLLSNFKIVAGTALYPSVFSVARPPLPAVAGTLVLLRAANQASAIVDTSGQGVVVNATGVAWNASSPAGVGGSLSFSGSIGSIIKFPPASARLGTADFTIEFWINAQSGTTVRPFSIGICCTTVLAIELRSAGAAFMIHPAGTVTSTYNAVWGTWQHMALVRLGVRLYWFVQGSPVAIATTSAATNFSATDTSPMFIGGDNTTTRTLRGMITNFRVVTGIALYPPAFVPPAMPLDAKTPGTTLLLPTNLSAPFADASSAAITVSPTSVVSNTLNPFDINGSLSFTGSAASIITVPAAAAAFDISDFTVEFFVNAQSSAFSRPFALGACCPSVLSVELQTSGTSVLCLSTGNIVGSWTAVFGVWHHMAVMRRGSYVVWFVNGRAVAYGAVSSSANFSASATTPFRIGGDSTTRVLRGLLSNVRLVTSAVYTALPSMNLPMDVVSGTLVHLSAPNSSASFADISGRGVVVNAVGVVWSSNSPNQSSGGSLYFSGSTSSILTIPPTAVQLGTGDFTIEFWMFANLAAYVRPFSIGVCCTSLLSIELTQASPARLVVPAGNIASSYTAVWGTWQHMALVRSNTSVVWFVNGAQVASTTVAASTNFSASAGAPCTIGGDSTFRALNGSISNFRIVAAASAFTPPAQTLAPIAGTSLLLNTANGALPFADSSGNSVRVTPTGVTYSSAGPVDPGPCVAPAFITCSQTQSASQTLSSTQTQTTSQSQSLTITQTASVTISGTASQAASSSPTLTGSQTMTSSATLSTTVTTSASQATTRTQSSSPSPAATRSATITPTASASPSLTQSMTRTFSQASTFSQTVSGTLTQSPSQNTSPSQSLSPSQLATTSPSLTSTQAATATQTPSATASITSSQAVSQSRTPTQSSTLSMTVSQSTSVINSITPTPSVTLSSTASQAASPSSSLTSSQKTTSTGTLSPTVTTSASQAMTTSSTLTLTPSQDSSPSQSLSPSQLTTPTSSITSTQMITITSTSSGTPSSTRSQIGSSSRSQTQSATLSVTVSQTTSFEFTLTPTPSITTTSTPSQITSATATPTGSQSLSPTATQASTSSASSSQWMSTSQSTTQSALNTVSSTVTPSITTTTSASQGLTLSASQTSSASQTASRSQRLSAGLSSSQDATLSSSGTISSTPSESTLPVSSSTRSSSGAQSDSLSLTATQGQLGAPSTTQTSSVTRATAMPASASPSLSGVPSASSSDSKQPSALTGSTSQIASTMQRASMCNTPSPLAIVSSTTTSLHGSSSTTLIMLPSASSTCTYTNVPVNVTVYGGVLPSTITSPSAGVLLRLSFACYLRLSETLVTLSAVTTTDPNVGAVILLPDASVNVMLGNCSDVAPLASSHMAEGTDPQSTVIATTAFLVLRACLDRELQSKLLSLSASSSNSTAIFGRYLDNLAASSGIHNSRLSLTIGLGSAPPNLVSDSSATRVSLDNPITVTVIAAIAVGLFGVLLIGVVSVCFVLKWRKKQRDVARATLRRAQSRSGDPGTVTAGVNPMQHMRKVETASAVRSSNAGVAVLIPDPALLPDTELLPWKDNPTFSTSHVVQGSVQGNSVYTHNPAQLRAGTSRLAATDTETVVRSTGHSDVFMGTNPLRAPRSGRDVSLRGAIALRSARSHSSVAIGADPSGTGKSESAQAQAQSRVSSLPVPVSNRASATPSTLAEDVGIFSGDNPLQAKRAAALAEAAYASRAQLDLQPMRAASATKR